MPAYTDVACPSCGTTLRDENMSLQTLSGRCPTCDALVDLRAAAPAGMPVFGDAQAAEPIPVPLPANVHVEPRGRDLVITRRWFSWVYIFLAFFCVVWNGFLVFFYGIIISAGAGFPILLFPALHVAVGIFLTYMTLAGFVNRTTFTVERDHLTVRHGPLPWRGNVDVPTTSLLQLFCTEQVSRSRNGTTIRYSVEGVLKDGSHLKLATALDTREQALFIEQTLEKHLGIQDRRVRSEMAR
ncbi:MAG TPA: hypothetical protein VLK84_30320 [Longimicrobium sp.]|nr:hypothetical protein [Longimicrobium sp.]